MSDSLLSRHIPSHFQKVTIVGCHLLYALIPHYEGLVQIEVELVHSATCRIGKCMFWFWFGDRIEAHPALGIHIPRKAIAAISVVSRNSILRSHSKVIDPYKKGAYTHLSLVPVNTEPAWSFHISFTGNQPHGVFLWCCSVGSKTAVLL